MTRLCVACGQPLLPGQPNVGFGTGGKVMFGAHAGECEELANEMVGGVAQVTRATLKARAPRFWESLQMLGEVARRITGGHDG